MNIIRIALLSLLLPVAALAQPIKAVFHIDDPSQARFALYMAQDHLKLKPDMQITLVAYAAGVDFLLKGETDRDGDAYAPDVAALMKQGVQFRFCAATLRFRELEESQVLTGVTFVPSGTMEILRLQAEEGFVYIKP
ncbi:hypothetical protein FCL40_03750 [Ferrimonas sediminicola]|uniref:Uncharacterized protein n=1 Tax=Ferrimonas sediminicola TaxID=2569538 RepID=A0A4U1BHP2_9GAMM|nr:DsrE family protein [Ferrimonas sediminicola]TKB50286.1 hypothetical protein FCL40_03750 [Ferrimonas sediminicola]